MGKENMKLQIIVNLSLWDLLQDIYDQSHNGFMNATNYNSNFGARTAMEKRIKYYQQLIDENKLKVK